MMQKKIQSTNDVAPGIITLPSGELKYIQVSIYMHMYS